MRPSARARRGEIRQFWRTFSRNQLACIGAVVVGTLVAIALAWKVKKIMPTIAASDPDRRLAMAMVLNSGIGTPFGDLRTFRISGRVLRCANRRR